MATKPTKPIMSADQERFMAYEGLLQWTQAVITQCRRVMEARDRQGLEVERADRNAFHQVVLDFHSQCHFFVIAAWKVIEYRKWSVRHGLFASADFGEIDGFPEQQIRDMRNMREHVVDYFSGIGRDGDRWEIETPEFTSDASGVTGTMIGGRLDWAAFTAAAERLLPQLQAQPIPYSHG